MANESELGAFVARYPTDLALRRRVGEAALWVGLALTVLGILWAIGTVRDPSPVTLVVVLAGLVVLGAAVWADRAHGMRTDEAYTLYQGGLVHAYGGRTWVIGWDDIARVVCLMPSGRRYINRPDGPVRSGFGWDAVYRVKLAPSAGGRRALLITHLTEKADQLGAILRRAAAGPREGLERDIRRMLREETVRIVDQDAGPRPGTVRYVERRTGMRPDQFDRVRRRFTAEWDYAPPAGPGFMAEVGARAFAQSRWAAMTRTWAERTVRWRPAPVLVVFRAAAIWLLPGVSRSGGGTGTRSGTAAG